MASVLLCAKRPVTVEQIRVRYLEGGNMLRFLIVLALTTVTASLAPRGALTTSTVAAAQRSEAVAPPGPEVRPWPGPMPGATATQWLIDLT